MPANVVSNAGFLRPLRDLGPLHRTKRGPLPVAFRPNVKGPDICAASSDGRVHDCPTEDVGPGRQHGDRPTKIYDVVFPGVPDHYFLAMALRTLVVLDDHERFVDHSAEDREPGN